MVYVDAIFHKPSANQQAFAVGKRHNHNWCHMWADSVEELVEFALTIGLKRAWLQNKKGRFPHFDLVPTYRRRAIANGAIETSLYNWYKSHRGHLVWKKQ